MSGSKIFYAAAALLVASCAGKENLPETRTPLNVEASLSGQLQTKATDDAFESGDKLLVYLRHMADIVDVPADKAPMLVEFTVGAAGKLTPETPLYWDDFSDSSTPGTDLRTAGHGLQSYYGYCYNGGTPSVELSAANGSLKWKVGNQTTAEAVKKADLLWSRTQTAVAYSHTPAPDPITVPFTHAMSQVTVVLTLGDGFEYVQKPLKNTVLTLDNVNKECTFYAPEGTYSSFTDGTTMKMYGKDNKFVAIVCPGTPLTVGEKFLDITDVDGNNYTLHITDAMLDATHWNATQMAPGVNYVLNITLSKTAIDVQATLSDWVPVSASGIGKIEYPDDVVTLDVAAGTFAENDEFYLFYSSDDRYDNVATCTYKNGKWTVDPVIYWPDATTSYYFRAVMGSGTGDLLWATTPAHNGYEAGAAIKPRTGNVPLAFEHVKSKITVNLETTADEAAVDFTDATIAISNLSVDGTLNYGDGSITPKTAVENAIPATDAISGRIVFPQTITDSSVMTITLANGAVYKLQLNQCLDATDTAIGEWERGKHYTYTIHVEKEKISFRALVKEWVESTGSGNANLEWD